MMGGLLFSLLVMVASPSPWTAEVAAGAADETVVARCGAWMADRRDSDAPGETFAVRGGVCFDGEIDARSAAGFAATLASVDGRPTIVVRSAGGVADAGIAMGRVIHERLARVVARDVCLSSCANYLLAAARVRLVASGTLLGFHGGASAMTPEAVAREAGASGRPLSPAQAEAASARMTRTAADQAALLRDAGIAADFLIWTTRFNALPEADRRRACSGTTARPGFLVFAPELLQARGYALADYGGPRSARELATVLDRFGLPGDFACYIDGGQVPYP